MGDIYKTFGRRFDREEVARLVAQKQPHDEGLAFALHIDTERF